MTLADSLPILVILSSAVASVLIFFLSNEWIRLRVAVYLGGQVVKLFLVIGLLLGVYYGQSFEVRIPLLPGGIDFLLRADEFAMLFLLLSAGLWLLTTLYSIGYLRGVPYHRRRFFGFFGFSVSATAGIALAGNLFTFFIFYEILTLLTYPLVVHRDTREAIDAGRKYLKYTLTGGQVLLVGIVALQIFAGTVEFTLGGVLGEMPGINQGILILIFVLLVGGLGVKTALVPLHSWLPTAMIAPTPVSALLHGVAVVKAGAFGILRVLYEVFGIDFSAELGVAFPLALVASFTIVYGSIQALRQTELKLLLAYSTVSQVSYIILGASLVGLVDTIGALVHLVHQGVMKVTLFFCAGLLAETIGVHKIKEMNGVARRMPATMAAFSLAAFGMMGLPPLAGFVSKWYLGVGAIETGQSWAVAVLVGSTLLNIAYFLPVIYASWLRKPTVEFEEQRPATATRFEADWLMLFPTLTLAALVLLMGLFAGLDISPLQWAELIAERSGQFD